MTTVNSNAVQDTPASAHDGLSRRAIYLHGSLAIPLAIYGYPLAIWLPALIMARALEASPWSARS